MNKMTIFTALILMAFCFSATAQQPQETPTDDDDEKYYMQVLLDSSCEGNAVTVSAEGENVAGAHVSVKDVSTASLVASGDTDGSGQFVFSGCGMKVDVKVTSPDYPSEILTQELIGCGQCGGAQEPGCTQDSDCPATAACSGGECVLVECSCGKVSNHECVEYECCADADCPAQKICLDHVCSDKPAEDDGACSSDSDCLPAQYCDKAAAQNTGSCKDVPDAGCGEVRNHEFVPYGYECGDEAGCPSCQEGYECIAHKCMQNEVTCPAQDVVGASPACDATENGEPCANCDYVVTDPSGKNSTGVTDENGSFTLPLSLPGTYKVALMKDGQAVKIIEVKSMPKAQGGDAGSPTGASSDMMPIIGGVLLLLLIAAGIFFWRGRAAKN